jgi:RNA polymerase sigma factor (sigma-70 family)
MVIERYESIVAHIAYEFSRKFHMIDVDDIRQELWIWFLEHPKKIAHWEKEYDEKNRTKLVARSLRNAAKDYCQREKAKVLGYRVEDNYYYDKQLLEAILPGVFNGTRTPPSLSDMGYSNTKKVLSEGNNWLAMCADVEKSLNKINKEQYLILSYRFNDGLEITKIAEELSITQDAARMRINRAMNMLLNMLGGNRPRFERDLSETDTSGTASDGNDSDVWDIPTQTFSDDEGDENDL